MSLVRKTSEVVADDIERQISDGSLKAGEQVPTIDQLAVQYGVGKSTVREAISQLKARGLVQPRQGEGTFVTQNAADALQNANHGFGRLPALTGNPDELIQLLQVRRLIEGGCAMAAAESANEDDLQRIASIVRKMEGAMDNEEMSRLYDIQFHMAIAKASRNPFLQKIMETISEALNQTIRDSRSLWLYRGQQQTRQLYLDHLGIYEAIRDREAGLAEQRIEAHLDNVSTALQEYLSKS